jgi:hypothetical protein
VYVNSVPWVRIPPRPFEVLIPLSLSRVRRIVAFRPVGPWCRLRCRFVREIMDLTGRRSAFSGGQSLALEFDLGLLVDS